MKHLLQSNLCSLSIGSQKDESSTRLRLVFDSFTCRYRLSRHLYCIFTALFLLLGSQQIWCTDQTITLTFEGTGSYPNNSDWTCDGSGSTEFNHTASGSKSASVASEGPLYFTYANSVTNVKSVTLYFLRKSNSTKQPTFVVQGRATDKDSWADKKSSGAVEVGNKNAWKEVTITLDAAYTGYIRIVYTCESNAGRWIDDITITYSAASCDNDPTVTAGSLKGSFN